ncbi:MAG: cytochrome bd-I oxidase subunit CydX [Pseudomonadota bacterium]
MWYFSWILGLGLAATVGILNALWYELRQTRMAPTPATEDILDETGDNHPMAAPMRRLR